MKWPTVTLGEICEFKYGKALPAAIRDGGEYPVFGSNGIVGYHSSSITNSPCIIIGRKGSFGEVHYSSTTCWPIDTTYYVDSDSTEADLQWLRYRLSALGLTELNRAAAIPGLNREDAYRLRLALPPLDEQRRIAAILDRAYELFTKRRAVLRHLDDLSTSMFHHAFSTPSADWPTTTVGDCAEVLTGYAFPSKQFARSGIRLCRGANVFPDRLDWQDVRYWPEEEVTTVDRYLLNSGDIILALDRPWISTGFKLARVQEADLPSLLVQRVARIRAKDNVSQEFLYGILGSQSFRSHCSPTETTIPHISPIELREFVFRIPTVDVQRKYEARITHWSRHYKQAKKLLGVSNELFASLQSRAFRGEL
ncbi:hypothetical protein A5699_26860 [Mycobacterium sp. E802]|uniref:restriction endonuclease subunit S n=1 Tax=Mycobacterium sp. E802 TaxID=1834152 RepID=UPI0007FD97C2|nr:restriction endonuclease subunit S [Mycobacterium sp. E802]OBG84519.1 hypothetical protein A5699_26860 [Mycobacterium sp. E802]